MRQTRLICIFLFCITLLVYLPVRQFEFVDYDDPAVIPGNPVVQNGLTWTRVKSAFSSNLLGNWIPLTQISYMMDCQFFGVNAGASHLVNVFFHALNTMLLFLLVRSMTASTWRSAIVAALFGWHPMHVESVAWIAERKDVLSAFFLILTCAAYVRYTRNRERKYYVLALLGFIAGLLSKPMLVTLPFALLLLDVWPLQRLDVANMKSRRDVIPLLVEKIPFFFLAAINSIITIQFQKAEGAMQTGESISWGQRFGTAFIAYQQYVLKLFRPRNLSVIYQHPLAWPGWQIAVAVILIFGVTALALMLLRRWPFVAVGWLWFLGMLVPVSGIIPVGEAYMADRYTYIPSIGLFMALIWSVGEIMRRLHWRPQVIALSVAVVLGLCLVQAEVQLSYWRNTITLLEHAFTIEARNTKLRHTLADQYVSRGRVDEGIAEYQEILKRDPEQGEVHAKLASALVRKNQIQEAIDHYHIALKIDPNSYGSLNNLAWILAANADPRFRDGKEAVELALRACQLTDYKVSIYVGTLAAAYAEDGKYSEAVEAAEKARTLALAAGETQVAERNAELLALYKRGQPYHEP